MELIDWRELYAANRAVIEGRRPLGEDIPLRRTPARPGPRRLAAPQPPPANEPGSSGAAGGFVRGDGGGWGVHPRRVYVAGMSAGGAMAAVMAATYPDLFAAVAVHSGLAFRCATSVGAATTAMTQGAPDPEAQGRAARDAMGHHARPVPAIVVHGTADRIVSPVNGEHAVRQAMAANRLAGDDHAGLRFERPASRTRHRSDGGLAYTRTPRTDA